MRCSAGTSEAAALPATASSRLRSAALAACLLLCVGCGHFVARELAGEVAVVPDDFSFVGDMSPCYLELAGHVEALRVNCFHLDGQLHIHSSRWAKLPRLGRENWIRTVRREPAVRVEIDGKIYRLQGEPIDDESRRQQILHDRGYWHAWDGITVVRFSARTS